MSVTINSTPATYNSVNDRNWWVVTSDNVSETNFKYVCDIYVGGNLVTRLKSFPNPNNNKGIFDVGNVLKNYISNYLNLGSGDYDILFSTNGIYVDYEVQFGEEYGGTTYLNLNSDSKFSYNYISDIAFGENPYLTPDSYQADWAESGLFLTKRTWSNLKLRRSTGFLFLSYLSNVQNTDVDYSLRFDCYDKNGTLLSSDTGATITARDLIVMNLSRQNINLYIGTPIITDSVDSFDVYLLVDGSDVASATIRLLCESKHTPTAVHFLNSLGGYDTMYFDLVNRQSRSVEKKSYEKYEWEYNSSTQSMERVTANKLNGGSTTFWNQQSIKYHLISDYVSLNDYYWLQDLITSKEVYVEFTGTLVPSQITTSEWSEKKRGADKLYNLELDLEIGSKVKG